jgi:hypothetical protein
MFKLSTKLAAVLAMITAFVLGCFPPLGAKAMLPLRFDALTLNQPMVMATAAAAPKLVPAVLEGKPVSVLYMTRAGDTVLVRCYPGYQPTLTVRAMGSNPSADTQKEGVMTCQRPSS